MINLKTSQRPLISYRSIRPYDLEVLEKIHCDLFPIRYETEFFHNVVNGHDIVSWGAVDRNRRNGQSDELIGFVTARIVPAKESEVEELLRFDSSNSNQTLVYILTLGVVESYRNMGIASSLIREVIKYATNIPTCRAVYLHVISYNNSAIHLYKKMSFQCVRRLHAFYYINGQHYDSYLFIYYVNGGRSPCSPLTVLEYCNPGILVFDFSPKAPSESSVLERRNSLILVKDKILNLVEDEERAKWCQRVTFYLRLYKRELVTLVVTCAKSLFKLASGRLWKNEDRKFSKWIKCKESGTLLPTMQNKRTLMTDGA